MKHSMSSPVPPSRPRDTDEENPGKRHHVGKSIHNLVHHGDDPIKAERRRLGLTTGMSADPTPEQRHKLGLTDLSKDETQMMELAQSEALSAVQRGETREEVRYSLTGTTRANLICAAMCCQVTRILLLLQAHSRLAAEAKLDRIRQDAEKYKWNDDGAQEDISHMLTEPNMYREDWELLVAAGFTLLFDVATVVWVSVRAACAQALPHQNLLSCALTTARYNFFRYFILWMIIPVIQV